MDRNYREDQENEIEALDSIYCGELESKDWFIYKKYFIKFEVTTEVSRFLQFLSTYQI